MYPNISFTQSSITRDKEASKATTVSQTVVGPQWIIGPFFFLSLIYFLLPLYQMFLCISRAQENYLSAQISYLTKSIVQLTGSILRQYLLGEKLVDVWLKFTC